MTSNVEPVAAFDNTTPSVKITVAETDAEEKKLVGIKSNDDQDQCNSTSNQDEDGITNTETISYPQADFPFTFYKFIKEVSVTHPDIVAWSECGDYFRIDRHAKELPALIGQYFQRKCLVR
jgi:adenosine/AMP kinase